MTKLYLLIPLLLSMLCASEQAAGSKYGVAQAKVYYRVSGGGILTDEINLTIEGNERFYLRDWGHERLWYGELTEKITSILEDRHTIEQMVKIVGDQAYEVNFKRKKIFKMTSDKVRFMRYNLKQMQPKGSLTIASYECQLWENDYLKVCLYKGIPLLFEKRYFDFTISKRARLLLTDINLSKKDFDLPAYPVEERQLLKSTFKVTQIHVEKSIAKQLCESQSIADKKGDKQTLIKETFLKALLRRQRVKLPKVLEVMQDARICFLTADDQRSANHCFSRLTIPLREMIQANQSTLSLWTQASKERIVGVLDRQIMALKKRIPCIKRAENIDYLTQCMK